MKALKKIVIILLGISAACFGGFLMYMPFLIGLQATVLGKIVGSLMLIIGYGLLCASLPVTVYVYCEVDRKKINVDREQIQKIFNRTI